MEARSHPAEIERVSSHRLDEAYLLVQEYYEVASVLARDTKEQFAAEYFQPATGFWLARVDRQLAGCIALRALPPPGAHGEIKRLYVRPPYRGLGIAQLLLRSLESFAVQVGYEALYLDTAADMKAAASLYRKSGYLPCNPYNENPQAAIFLRKLLPRVSGGSLAG